MRILHFLGPIRLPLSPDVDATGGIARVALETARAQAALGHEVSVVAVGARRGEARWQGVRLVHLRALPGARWLRFRWMNPEAHVPLIAFTSTRAFDVVHVHEHWNVRFVRAGVCILHVHNDPFGEPGTPRFIRKAHAFWARARRSTAQVGVSRFISRRLVDGLRVSETVAPAAPHIRTVRNGVDHARFAPDRWAEARDRLRSAWAVDADDVVFLFAGAVTPDKGAIHLAHAFVERLGAAPAMRLVLAGGGALWRREATATAEANGYEQAVASALEPAASLGRVQRLGVVPPDELPGVYAASDVIVVPSIVEEAFGLVVLEAMAAGKPVIASRVGGIPELVGQGTGILVPPGDVAALGEAMTQLAEDARLRRDLSMGASAAAQRYTWTDSARRLDRIYRWAQTATRAHRPHSRRERVQVITPELPPQRVGVRAHAGAGSASAAPGAVRVSVIVPVFNAVRYLEECIGSVLGQSFTEWELLLVDDASTDGSEALARGYAERHPERIRYLEHPGRANRGVSATRNLGLAHARGEYVAFLDADDVWFPTKLEEQIQCFRANDAALMVYGRAGYWYSWTGRPEDASSDDEFGMGVGEGLFQPPVLVTALVEGRGRAPLVSDALVRTTAARGAGGFPEDMSFYEDRVFFVRVELAGPVYVAERCWVRYRQHAASSSATIDPRRGRSRARGVYLRRLEKRLAERGYRGSPLWDMAREQSFAHRHPFAATMLDHARRLRGRLRRRAHSDDSPAAAS